mgnify:CR=1 FL=1
MLLKGAFVCSDELRHVGREVDQEHVAPSFLLPFDTEDFINVVRNLAVIDDEGVQTLCQSELGEDRVLFEFPRMKASAFGTRDVVRTPCHIFPPHEVNIGEGFTILVKVVWRRNGVL